MIKELMYRGGLNLEKKLQSTSPTWLAHVYYILTQTCVEATLELR
jgi:hypothetical protein